MAKKERAKARARGQHPAKRSNYAWHRNVPWIAIGAALILLVLGVVIARSLGVGEGAGRYIAGGGIGDHRPAGQAIAYPSYPPTSGTHSETPTSWGFHTEPVVDELAVHNLEHGGVVISYNNISPDDQSKLRSLLASYPKDRFGEVKLVIRPYDRIASGSIVLTAWNWIDELAAYDEARVRAFMDAHLNKCCEAVP
ncbi:MAG TPA: DUF3105 domain-containing protein [Candidatus Limnocylindria bacterium]